jgi:ribosomal 30S subunit maturation factor RimM
MIPYVDEFIKNIDLENKKIEINVIEGLINEN